MPGDEKSFCTPVKCVHRYTVPTAGGQPSTTSFGMSFLKATECTTQSLIWLTRSVKPLDHKWSNTAPWIPPDDDSQSGSGNHIADQKSARRRRQHTTGVLFYKAQYYLYLPTYIDKTQYICHYFSWFTHLSFTLNWRFPWPNFSLPSSLPSSFAFLLRRRRKFW